MELRLEKRHPDDLIPSERNVKQHGEEVAMIEASIRRFGFNDPIGILPDGTIVEGHGRLIAAKNMGLEEVPVIVLEGFSERDADLYRIAHNKITLSTNFDFSILIANLRLLIDEDITYEVLGFDEDAAARLIGHGFTSVQRAVNSERLDTTSATTREAAEYLVIWDNVEQQAEFDRFLDAIRGRGEGAAVALLRKMAERLGESWEGSEQTTEEHAHAH